MHTRVREDGIEAKYLSLIKLADALFAGQYLCIFYLAQTMLQTVSYFPINAMLHPPGSSQLAVIKRFVIWVLYFCFLCHNIVTASVAMIGTVFKSSI